MLKNLQLINVPNKLKCLSLATLSQPNIMFPGKAGAYLMGASKNA
jgi:hypothetical protein